MTNTFSRLTLFVSAKNLLACVALICLTCVSMVGQVIEDIVGKGAGVHDVYIESGDISLQRAAQRLFQLHGGFLVRPTVQGSSIVIQLQATSDRQVAYRVTGQGGQPFTGGAGGASLMDALMKGGDQIVERLTGQPGFFQGKIVFVGLVGQPDLKEVFVTNLLFESTVKLTNFRSTVRSPRWSPDGREILFTTFHRTGFPDIYRINLNTRQVTPFATFGGINQAARYSPDGTQVALSLSSPGNAEIFVSNAAGTPGSFRRLTRSSGAETSPSWSPDGRTLVLVSDQLGFPQLYYLPATGGNMTRVPTNISRNCTEPDWNPVNPNLICFTVAESGRFAIAVFDRSTGQSQIVSRSPHDAVEPRWLPDGRHILHTARSTNYSRLVVLDTKTGRTTAITPDRIGRAMQGDFVRPL